MNNENYKQLGIPTEKKIGKTVYIVKGFGNINANKTAKDLLLEIAEKRLQCDVDNGDFYKKLSTE